MDDKILVAYVTKYGATAEIAEKIGQVLREQGLEADVLLANRVKNLNQYKAFIIGSAVYMGQWQKDAAKLLKANEKILSEKPTWIFSSGPPGEGDPVTLSEGWCFPTSLQPIIDRIKPRDIALFHGVLDEKKLNSLERFVMKNVKAVFGDFRDWNTITSWATSIAQALKKQA